MGGVISGSWFRCNTKRTTESLNKLDIRYLQREGFLNHGPIYNLSWTRHGKPNGNIHLQHLGNYLELSYKVRSDSNSDWRDVVQHIEITKTPCNYGGKRLWFSCPDCESRVAILYFHNLIFHCRHCSNLTYDIQNQCHHGRMLERRNRAYAKIHDKHGRLKNKPKGMHCTTWAKYWTDYIEADYQTDLALIGLFRKQHFLTEEELQNRFSE